MDFPTFLDGKKVRCPHCKCVTSFSRGKDAIGSPAETFEFKCPGCGKVLLVRKPKPAARMPKHPPKDFSASILNDLFEELLSKKRH
jgi:uncharacterized C2H2 Zn-finger protein